MEASPCCNDDSNHNLRVRGGLLACVALLGICAARREKFGDAV